MRDISAFGLCRDQVKQVIDAWIFSRRDRRIFELRYLDGLTYEKIAEEVDLSPRQVKNIIYKKEYKILKELERAGK